MSAEAAATYALFAKFYDLYAGAYAADLPFYLALAAEREPILEVGCGTGRVLLALLAAGHVVTGLDISPEMLALARTKLAQIPEAGNTRLICHDLTEAQLPMDAHFSLVLVTFFTFNYLLTEERRLAMLRRIYDCLAPGGALALHLFFPAPLAQPDMSDQWRNKGKLVLDGMEIEIQDKRRMLEDQVEERLQVFGFAGGRREEIRTLRRYLSKTEMFSLLERTGFIHPRVVEDFDDEGRTTFTTSMTTTKDYFISAERPTEEAQNN